MPASASTAEVKRPDRQPTSVKPLPSSPCWVCRAAAGCRARPRRDATRASDTASVVRSARRTEASPSMLPWNSTPSASAAITNATSTSSRVKPASRAAPPPGGIRVFSRHRCGVCTAPWRIWPLNQSMPISTPDIALAQPDQRGAGAPIGIEAQRAVAGTRSPGGLCSSSVTRLPAWRAIASRACSGGDKLTGRSVAIARPRASRSASTRLREAARRSRLADRDRSALQHDGEHQAEHRQHHDHLDQGKAALATRCRSRAAQGPPTWQGPPTGQDRSGSASPAAATTRCRRPRRPSRW